jgi:hypothetical protein
MAQAAYRLGFVFLAALIAAPAGAGTPGKPDGLQNIGDGGGDQTIPFSSIAPDVVVPPGEEDQSAGDDGGGDNGAGPPDDGPPVSANGTDHAIPA